MSTFNTSRLVILQLREAGVQHILFMLVYYKYIM